MGSCANWSEDQIDIQGWITPPGPNSRQHGGVLVSADFPSTWGWVNNDWTFIFFGWTYPLTQDKERACSTHTFQSAWWPRWKCTGLNRLSRPPLFVCHSPVWQVESFGNFSPSSEFLPCYPRNARQSDQTGRDASSAAVRLTPSDVPFGVLSSRSARTHEQRALIRHFRPVETRSTSRAVSRILHLSGHQTPLYWWLS